MKNLIILCFIASASSASACFDRDAKPLTNDAIQSYAELANFSECLDKIAALGVDLNEVTGARRDREPGDNGPITYTIMVQGRDAADRLTRIYINYDLSKHGYTCAEPTHNIPRCF